jgi:hypothetical protein
MSGVVVTDMKMRKLIKTKPLRTINLKMKEPNSTTWCRPLSHAGDIRTLCRKENPNKISLFLKL